MNYVLDTNILLIWLKDPVRKKVVEESYGPLNYGNTPIISAVTIGEMRSLALKNSWGDRRIKIVEDLIEELVIVGVQYSELFDAYARIDAFSQGKLAANNISARNMGKNDLWIAATAMVTNSRLITADKDFKHLDGAFFEVIYLP